MPRIEHIRASALALTLLTLVGLPTRPARASTTQVSLEWVRMDGAESCPSAAALRAEVTRRLGRDPFRPGAPRTIEGIISRRADAWRAEIFVRDASGETIGVRELSSLASDCQSLGAAATLAISLVIDPTALASAAAPPPPPHSPPDAQHEASPPDAVQTTLSTMPEEAGAAGAPSEDAESGRGVAGDIGARAVLAIGLLPHATAGVGIGGGVSVAYLRLELGMFFLPEVDARDRDFSFGLTALRLGLGVDLPVYAGKGRIRFLAVGSAGTIHAVVRRYMPTEPGQRVWGALGLAAEFAAVLRERGFVSLGAVVLAPLVRHVFRVEGRSGTLFQQDRATLLLQLSLGVHFL